MMAFVLVVSIVLGAAAAHAAGLQAGEETCLHVPRMDAPTFDGKITDAEWGDAAALSGPVDVGSGLIDSRPATFLLGWDPGNIYMAVRAWMPRGYKPRIRGGRAPGFADCFDDGLEMVVRPMGENVSNQNHRTDFKFNISCLGYGGTYTRLVVGQLMKNWEPDFETAVRVTEDGTAPHGGRWWEMEVAFSLDDFELIADNRAGDRWRMMLGINHLPKAGWMQQRIPSVGGYFTADGKTVITLVEQSPVVRLTMEDVPNLASDGTAVLTIAASNPSQKTAKVEVDIDVAGKIRKTQALSVPADGRKEIVLNQKLPEDVRKGHLVVSAVSGGEKVLFYKGFFQVGRYNNRLVAPPASDPNKFPFTAKFNPLRRLLYLKADSYNLPDPDAVRGLEYVVATKDEGETIRKGRIEQVRTWYYESVLLLPQINPGEYEVTGHFLLENGTRLGPRSGSFRKLNEAKEFAEWWGKDTGRSERVVWPYEAIRHVEYRVSGGPITDHRSSGTGPRFALLGREYAFNGLGLPTSVRSRKGAVLAAPARIVVVADGKETVVPVGAPRITSRKDWRVRFKGEATGGGLAFSAEGYLAQDGMVLVNLNYGPEGEGPARIEGLRIEYPVENDVAECLTSVGPGSNFAAITATVLPQEKQGQLWSVFDTGRSGAQMKVGSFYPHVWLGNEKRGLQWWADSDAGWIPRDEVPAHEVLRVSSDRSSVIGDQEATDDRSPVTDHRVVLLRNNIVGKPVELSETRTLQFTWTATPFKPLPKGWRNFAATEDGTFVQPFRGMRINPETNEKYTTSTISWINPESENPEEWGRLWIENRTMGAPVYSKVDGEWKLQRRTQPAVARVFRYLPSNLHAARNGVSLNHQSFQVIGWGRKSQDKELFAYFGDQWYPGKDTWNESYVDYAMWLMNRAFVEGGVVNTYWDLAFPILYDSPLSGLAYQLPDGRWQPCYNTLNLRNFYRRLWAVQDVNDLNPGAVGTHSTNAYIFPALPWLDAVLDGERDWNLDTSDRDWIDYYPIERMRAMSVPHNWGVGICWMGNFHSSNKAKLYEHKTRQAEYVWMHDSWINPYISPAGHVRFMPQSILDWGMNGESVTYEPYWRKKYADSGDEDVLVTVWRIPEEAAGRILVGIFNYDRAEAKDVAVRLDLEKLGFDGKPLVMNDLYLDYTRRQLARAKARKRNVAALERVLGGLGDSATFDEKRGVLQIENLGSHRGRFVGVGAVNTEALARVEGQLPDWIGDSLPQRARDFGIVHWRTRHIPEGTTMAATCGNAAIKLGMWKMSDRVVLSVYNDGDKATDATVALNLDYLGLRKRLLWQEFVRAVTLHGGGRQSLDYYGAKLHLQAIPAKSGRLVGIRRY
jgi:hypothetical protein